MHSFFRRLALGLVVVFGFISVHRVPAQPFTITVHAGDHGRRETIVRAPLPSGINVSALALSAQGRSVAWQQGPDGAAYFIVTKLAKGAAATFELGGDSSANGASIKRSSRITTTEDGGRIHFALAMNDATTRSLMSYQTEPGEFPRPNIKPVFRRGGYLHPIRTPAGLQVTDDFPTNHVHHHGVWWAWTHTEFNGRQPDFWNMGDGKGRVEFAGTDATWSGELLAGFRSRHRFVDLTSGQPVAVLKEMWEVTAYSSSPSSKHWMFDVVSEQECATAEELKLPTYRYGGIGVRGNWDWNGKDKTFFLTSEGETDRDKGNATRGRWCDMSGDVDGKRAGMAVLCHPDNFRFPQPMRLHPSEPFFNFAPQQAGDMEIKPGVKYVSRYRFVIHDGPPDRTELERLWNDYAHPPKVTVSAR